MCVCVTCLLACAQDELALQQAPSFLMEQASANLSSTMTGRSSNSSCASNLPPPPPMPAAQPVQQEPELPKTAPSVNRRKDLLFFLFPIFGSPISLSLSLFCFLVLSALLFRTKGIYHCTNQRPKAIVVMRKGMNSGKCLKRMSRGKQITVVVLLHSAGTITTT